MSRIGKIPVIIPDKVKVQVKNQHVAVEGPNGKLSTIPKTKRIENNFFPLFLKVYKKYKLTK